MLGRISILLYNSWTFKQLHTVSAVVSSLNPYIWKAAMSLAMTVTTLCAQKPQQQHFSTHIATLCLFAMISLIPLQALGQTQPTITTLPELSTAQNTPASPGSPVQLNVNENGISLNGQLSPDTRFTLRPEYSNQTGLAINAGIATLITEQAALGFLLTAGTNKTELIANVGWQIDARQDLVLSYGQLQQRLEYHFLSGPEKARMTQRGGGLSYQYHFARFVPQAKDNPLLQTLELNLYHTNTPSRELGNRLHSIDTENRYELWNDPRRIAGGQISGGQARIGLSPFSGSLIKFSLGQERLRYDLKAGTDTTNRLTSGITWQQQLTPATQTLLSAERNASQDRYRLGWQHRLASTSGQHQIGMELTHVEGRDGLGNDTQVQFNYIYSFDLGSRIAYSTNRTHNAQNTHNTHNLTTTQANQASLSTSPNTTRGQLLERVAQRPAYLPSHVVAKVDTTAPERLIAINKTGLPTGSQINPANGDITVPLGAVILNLTSASKNGALFTDSGQFTLIGNNLLIKPSRIAIPASGSDNYLLTFAEQGGGTTTVDIAISHGSVKIDHIIITHSGAGNTTPDAFSFTAQNDVKLSTQITSNAITVSGISAASPISITGGEYQIDSGTWTSAASAITNGQSVKVRHTSSSTYSTVTSTMLTIGGVSAGFTSTTRALPTGYLSYGELTWAPVTDQYKNWNDANTQCTNSTALGYSDWRMPTVAELQNIAQNNQSGMSAAAWTLFGTWSSDAPFPGTHWDVDLSNGLSYPYNDGDYLAVSCVR